MNKCSNKRGYTLPEEVRNLIARKLRQQRQEQEQILTNAKQSAFRKLHAEKQVGGSARKWCQVPLESYRVITTNAVAVTEKLPWIAWNAIEALLEKAQVEPVDGQELNAIINKFTWETGEEPFTLHWVESERFREAIHRDANRYGLNGSDILVTFDRQLNLSAAEAKCTIINVARQVREAISIAIDEHQVINLGEGQSAGDAGSADHSPTHPQPMADADCNSKKNLPNPPQQSDDWFLAIKDMAVAFSKEYGRCPNAAEAWAQLRANPPPLYGITPGVYKDKDAVYMDKKPLAKHSFNQRWGRYTDTNEYNST